MEAEYCLLFEIIFCVENAERRIIMADTARGYWPKESCSDCGEAGVVIFKHWGPLVPEGQVGHLCLFCWNERENDCKEGKIPIPLGRKPFIECCFIPGKIKVVTKSGSVYRFDKPNKEKIRTVVRDSGGLPFSLCRIKCLKENKLLYLISIDGNKEEIPVWITSKVLSIEIEKD